jgi:hypothetical protein
MSKYWTWRLGTYSFFRVSLDMPEITIRKRAPEEALITQRKFFKKTARGKVIKGGHTALD